MAELLDAHRQMSEAVEEIAARVAARMAESKEEAVSVTSASRASGYQASKP